MNKIGKGGISAGSAPDHVHKTVSESRCAQELEQHPFLYDLAGAATPRRRPHRSPRPRSGRTDRWPCGIRTRVHQGTAARPADPRAHVKLSLGGALYDPGDPMGKMFFNILATFAEFEVDLLRMRTREGMAVAKAKGKLRGKQPKLTTRQQAHLVKEHRSGEHTIADLAELFSVSRATVYRVLERHQTSVAPSTSGGK
ncbi:recombinase family protein [Streptomyces sp. NBC_01764]|uniref:recombinase family protein n=2 Tax=unclassified Streptomyces TaxID=2593676 RepID=UPI00224EE985|nr:recombinase family protein [Streptomyces sp. NBC_01764]MCX4403989.1 recombinase family protein [Streptomyces sp. NBC_01764]